MALELLYTMLNCLSYNGVVELERAIAEKLKEGTD
jgi:hypothetical protein